MQSEEGRRLPELPPESWNTIFHFCLPSLDHPVLPSTAARQSPFIPLQICKLWRSIALSDPTLFTRLSFRLHTQVEVHRIIGVLKRCFGELAVSRTMRNDLERYEYSPISLTLHQYAIFQEFDEDYIPNLVLGAIVPFRERFVHLDLRLPQLQLHSFWNLPPGSFRSLKSLKVWTSHRRHQPGIPQENRYVFPPTFLPGLSAAPLLRDVTLDTSLSDYFGLPLGNGSWVPTRSGISWEQLTSVNLPGVLITGPDLLDLLRISQSLIRGTFTLSSRLHLPLSPLDETISLPFLSTLRLTLLLPTSSKVLAWLTLPSLKELFIAIPKHEAVPTISGGTSWSVFGSIRSCVERSSSKVETLHIRVDAFINETHEVLAMLKPMSCIRDLEIWIPDLDSKLFFRSLTKDGEQPILPSLERLSITGDAVPAQAMTMVPAKRGIPFLKVKTTLAKMMKSRIGQPLKSIKLETRSAVSSDGLKSLYQLAEGVDIVVVCEEWKPELQNLRRW